MHHSSDKKKPSPSPSRRGSSAGDGGSGSKTSTPAPSPQHTTAQTETSQPLSGRASGSSTPSTKVTPPAASPSGNKPVESVGVISTVTSTTTATVSTITTVPTTSTAVTTSVVQVPPPKTTYQESVITNAESMETKQTKKRKAVNAANMNAAAEYMSTTPPAPATEAPPPQTQGTWEPSHTNTSHDVHMEPADKVIKKAKTDNMEPTPVPTSHFSSVSPAPPPPPPPPAHSPASQPSPRHLPSPMPGPSGMNQVSNIRSPSQPQVAAQTDMPGPSPHIFHQPQKQAAMDTSVTGHSPHALPSRTWGGLNVAYEMQQDPNKPGVSGLAGTSKDMAGPSMGQMPPATIRNKKRAAMNSVVAMGNAPTPMQTTTTQTLASVRRQPQPTPPPIYQETIKDSPPSSPSSERPLKPKMESSKMGSSCTAPHMLGNELNPESGAAACLQEQLTAELAAHAAGTAGIDPLIPPPLINKAAAGASSNSGRGSSGAQSLDQLLERQWEQGSQFLMEQAQHFDIASLLSCLHQLRTENVRLEDHVGNLQLRRDHLLAVNARLAIPLTTVTSGPPEPSRCQMQRENGAQIRPPPPQVRAAETITSERSHQLLMREVQQKPS